MKIDAFNSLVLDVDEVNSKRNTKVAKAVLAIYNKINGTNFKCRTPKIIVFRVKSK